MTVQKVPTVSCATKSLRHSLSHRPVPSFSSLLLQLFSIVIFGCIANEGYINRPNEIEEYCIFNRNQNACNYGVFMGSMAFLCCMAFLALDVYFPQISSVKDRKKAVLADIGLSGKPRASILFYFIFITFIWLLCYFYTCITEIVSTNTD